MDLNIQSRIIRLDEINWRELKFIQQDDFKELPQDERHRLKASMISNQFMTPFFVWEDESSGIIYCLDGKHRTIILEELITEGVYVPYKLPAVFIHCTDKKDASKSVLLFSSYYAHITQKGLHTFLEINGLNLSDFKMEVNLPDFSFDRFEQKFDIHRLGLEDLEEEVETMNPVVKVGDMFRLNGHKLYCGSFMDDSVSELLNEKARIIFTDPPYNLKANDFTNKGEKKHKDFAMGGGEMNDAEFVNFLCNIMKMSKVNSVDGSIHYICMDWRHIWHMTEASKLVYGSQEPKNLIVWKKDLMANGSFYRSHHELVFVFKSGTEKHLSHLELKDRIRSNVWEYPSATSLSNEDRGELKNHPTPKPVQMVADAILDTTNENDLVIDWFGGSGTTMIAAEKTGRTSILTEIEPVYSQNIIKRYVNYCKKNSVEVNFEHLNGNLTLNEIFEDEKSNFQGDADS